MGCVFNVVWFGISLRYPVMGYPDLSPEEFSARFSFYTITRNGNISH